MVRATLLAAVLLGLAGQLRAQDTVAVLPPLNVEATRSTRPWLAVPLAVTRLEPGRWFGASGFGLDDALRLVPGVLAQSRYGGSDIRLSIRGAGARGAGDRSNAGTSRGVRLLLDGVPETEPDGRTAFDHADLALISGMQVIRSNAGALWGNASGGVMLLSTVDPEQPRVTRAEAQAGSFGLVRGVVRAGGTLGSRGAISAGVVHTRTDGWRAHSDADRWTGTLSIVAPAGVRSRLGIYAIATDNAFRIPGPLTRAQADSAPASANATYAARDERRHNRLGRVAVTLDHELSDRVSVSGMLFAGPKYLQRSERGTFRDFTRYHVGGNAVGRLAHAVGGRAALLTAGVDEAYQDGAILFYNLGAGAVRGDTLRDNKREGANNVGLFAQEEFALGRLDLSLGARYDAISYYYQSFLDPSLDASKVFRRVSPKIGASWRATARRSVYASVGGGVEAPAGNETDPAGTFGTDTVTAINPLLEPIRSTTFEAGTKYLAVYADGWMRSLMYDVALYTTGVTNDIVPYRGGRFYFTAGRTRRSGAELGLRLDTRAGVQVTSAISWSRNRYVAYVVDSVHYGRPGATADYSGNKAVGVPDLIADVGLGYGLRGALPLTVRANVVGVSSYFADDANTVTVPGYAIVNATAGVEQPVALGRGIGLRGFVTVNNVFDRAYTGSAFLNPDVVGGVPVAFEPGLPRHVIVSLSLVRL